MNAYGSQEWLDEHMARAHELAVESANRAPSCDDDPDELDALMDELDAEEREAERLARQTTLYLEAPKRGDRG